MIKTLMFTTALLQADPNHTEQITLVETVLVIDKQAVATQLKAELNNALVQMSQSLIEGEQQHDASTNRTDVVENNILDADKLTLITPSLSHFKRQ
ncbi:hypothetical protein L2719_03445 [Shewanella schlegeliana]|uniref:Uncharacterized protein n=1 Tax=Shewanella schlegeliana TaxID=190308 RepID=A0ABS1SZQ3_9GAMM|nr:hypothetical protein [Shewanella schlegeliana]MBL4914009.1 hypothetical protein [Shewanella schlegeliana]MCL1108607.1 hypothetical protein [Shewanella schlegeliana]GIU35645.1 hypothetical protein TUM4433_33300 [Shewanella schlegeliana]